MYGQHVLVCNFNGLVMEFPVHDMEGLDSGDSSGGEGRGEEEEEEEEEKEEEGEGSVDQHAQAAHQEESKHGLEEDAVRGAGGRVEKRRKKRRGLLSFGLSSRSRQRDSDDDDDGGGDGSVMEVEPSDRKAGSSAEALGEEDNPKPPKKGGWLKGLFRRSSKSNGSSADPSPSMEDVLPPVLQECMEEEEACASNEEGDTPTLSD